MEIENLSEELNKSFLALLNHCAPEVAKLHEDKTLNISDKKKSTEDLVKTLVQTAKLLETKLNLLSLTSNSNNSENLKDEISLLRNEINEKDRLIEKYSQKIEDWEDTFRNLSCDSTKKKSDI